MYVMNPLTLLTNAYRRFIVGPTLNNSKKGVDFFENYHLMLLKM